MTQPLLSSLLQQAQQEPDLRRALFGATEAMQAVARGLSHPREVLTLACQVAQLARQALRTGSGIICGLEDAAQAADDAATQHHAAQELYLCERELCQGLILHRAGRDDIAKVHVLCSIRALSRAIEGSGNRPEALAYLADLAAHAYVLGEECAKEEPAPGTPPEGPEGEGAAALADAPAAEEGEEAGPQRDRGTMNRRAA